MYKLEHEAVWPTKSHSGIPFKILLQSNKLKLTRYTFPEKAMEYLLFICEVKEFQVATLQLTLSLSARYLKSCFERIQLVLLVSLFIASKGLEHRRLSVGELHQFSNHCFTNNDVYRCENAILKEVNYDIFSEGLTDSFIKTELKLLSQLIPAVGYQHLIAVSEDVQKYLWCSIYRGEIGGIKNLPVEHLAVAVINASIILATKCNGRFPHTVWMCKIARMQFETAANLTETILKVVLGKEAYKDLVI